MISTSMWTWCFCFNVHFWKAWDYTKSNHQELMCLFKFFVNFNLFMWNSCSYTQDTLIENGPSRITSTIIRSCKLVFSQGDKKVIDTARYPACPKRVRPISKQGLFESRRLWQHVTASLKCGDVNTATEHKKYVSDKDITQMVKMFCT